MQTISSKRTLNYFTSVASFTMLCVALLSGCHDFPKAPTYPIDDAEYQPGGISRTGVKDDPPPPLVLLPGDTVTVRTISSESFEYPGLIVDSEGKLHLPMAGAIEVGGLPLHVAEKKIEESLQRFDRFVRASLLVSAWTGHTATVIGSVANEGARQITPGMHVAELIAAAGGLLRTGQEGGEVNYVGDLDAARLVRNNQSLPISVRLALIGDPKHNVRVHAGDQLFIPTGLGSRIAVLGHVGVGGVMLTYRPGIRLTEALASAGGITMDADDRDIRVIRGPLADPLVYEWSLEALTKDRIGDVELAPGDVVFVTEHWVASMGEVINRVAPLLTVLTSIANTYLIIETLNRQQNNNASPSPGIP